MMLLNFSTDFNSRYQDSELLSTRASTSIPFASEEALIQDFSLREKLKSNNSLGYILELDAGNGIADIGLYELREDYKKYADIASVRPQWTYPLVRLPYRKKFLLEDFKTLACVSQKTARIILNEYSLAGFCSKTSRGWIKLHQPRPPINKIYAIEAKLRNWKKALFQASRYHDFATQSWVLLDHYYCRVAIKNKNEFIKRNVGLASIEKDGKLLVHIKPENSKPKSQYRYWYAANLILSHHLREVVPIEPVY